MTSPSTSETRRRRLRRPQRATRVAVLVLLLAGAVLALPQAGLAQDLDAAEAGGVAAPPEPEITADTDVAVVIEEAIAPEAPAVPSEAPSAPPAAAPEPTVAPEPPALPEPPEPPVQPVPEPTTPVNLNVDIRVLSPGDDGDVDQGGGSVVELTPGAGVEDVDIEFNWTWRWQRACEPVHASSVTMNWVWEWVDGCEAAVAQPVPEIPRPRALDAPPIEGAEPPAADGVEPPGGEEPLVAAEPRRAAGGTPAAPRGAALDTTPGADLWDAVPAAALAPGPAASARGGAAPRHDEAGRSGRTRVSPKPGPQRGFAPLSAAAATSMAPGGSSGPLAVALLALLCLLVPRLLELAPPARAKLSSLLSSGRLERPG